MKPEIVITNAWFSDLQFVASNLRQEDRIELSATRDVEDWYGLAIAGYSSFYKKAAIWNRRPVFVFGAAQTPMPGIVQVWGFGTPNAARVLKPVTKYIKQTMVPELLSQGVIEARAFSHPDNLVGHRWLKYLGYTPGATISGAGARKEDSLILFSVSADDLRRTLPCAA